MKNNQASHKLLRFIGNMSDQDQESLMKAIKDSDKELQDLHTIQLANKLETMGEWEQAAEQWESICRNQDAKMCMSIHNQVKEREGDKNRIYWYDFHKQATRTDGNAESLKEFEKEFGRKCELPHIKHALSVTDNFNDFFKLIKPFEL